MYGLAWIVFVGQYRPIGITVLRLRSFSYLTILYTGKLSCAHIITAMLLSIYLEIKRSSKNWKASFDCFNTDSVLLWHVYCGLDNYAPIQSKRQFHLQTMIEQTTFSGLMENMMGQAWNMEKMYLSTDFLKIAWQTYLVNILYSKQ